MNYKQALQKSKSDVKETSDKGIGDKKVIQKRNLIQVLMSMDKDCNKEKAEKFVDVVKEILKSLPTMELDR